MQGGLVASKLAVIVLVALSLDRFQSIRGTLSCLLGDVEVVDRSFQARCDASGMLIYKSRGFASANPEVRRSCVAHLEQSSEQRVQ